MNDRALSAGEYLLGAAELGLIVGCARLRGSSPPALRPARLLGHARPGRRRGGRDHARDRPRRTPGHIRRLHGARLPDRVARRRGILALAVSDPGSEPLQGRVEGSPDESDTPPAPPAHRLGLPIVAIVVAAIFAGWAIPTLSGITGGMGRADSLWYHMPLSARFVETGSTGELFFFDPIFFASFYPANSEVLHAIPILTFTRDFLSPLLNLGFLGLGLTSRAGRSAGHTALAPQALLGAAVVLGAETMTDFQAGEALNDIAGVAFLLCARRAPGQRPRGARGRAVGQRRGARLRRRRRRPCSRDQALVPGAGRASDAGRPGHRSSAGRDASVRRPSSACRCCSPAAIGTCET